MDRVCLSGGAQGADQQWGMTAGEAGHDVFHFSFTGHRINVPAFEIVTLTPELLDAANDRVGRAAQALRRRVPSQPFVRNLIRRNFYQVEWSSSSYAVSQLKGDYVDGGTAWALAMMRDRDSTLPQYVFCQDANGWFEWDDAWCAIDSPPPPDGIWAGIGSRNLTTPGKEAIRALMGWRRPEKASY